MAAGELVCAKCTGYGLRCITDATCIKGGRKY